MEPQVEKKGFYFQFFQRQYPAWMYSVVIALFAAGIYVWIEFFLVVEIK